jgi:hypothetical protein
MDRASIIMLAFDAWIVPTDIWSVVLAFYYDLCLDDPRYTLFGVPVREPTYWCPTDRNPWDFRPRMLNLLLRNIERTNPQLQAHLRDNRCIPDGAYRRSISWYNTNEIDTVDVFITNFVRFRGSESFRPNHYGLVKFDPQFNYWHAR